MKASDWEFKNRAMLFGLVFAVGGPLYSLDHRNAGEALARWLASGLGWNGDLVVRLVFVFAAAIVAIAALLRTWASAYLHAGVVYAQQVKTATLVADGPYRFVRNPLYLGNAVMSVGMGLLLSRLGLAFAVVATVVICYRLILREEAELASTQGESYREYLERVPRMLPALTPRVAPGTKCANWASGFKAELWFWGFALATAAFAATLKMLVFLAILAVSIGALFASARFIKEDVPA